MSFSCSQSLDGSFPPSPVGDHRGPKRLSVGGLLQKLAELKGTERTGAPGAAAADPRRRSTTGEGLQGLETRSI